MIKGGEFLITDQESKDILFQKSLERIKR